MKGYLTCDILRHEASKNLYFDIVD